MKHARLGADSAAALHGLHHRGAAGADLARECAEDTLLPFWERLERRAFLPTQGHAYAAALSRTILAGQRMETFFVPGSGGIGALLPLCRGPGWLARWRMVGACEIFEPGDALSESPEAARLLAEKLARLSRPMRLDRIPAGSLLVPAMKAAMKGKGLVLVRPATACPTIALDERWQEPETRFNARRRSDFRRAARKAEAFGSVTFEVLSPGPDEFQVLFDEALGVELRSWKKEAGTAIASERGKEDFFRDYFAACSREGRLRIAFMRIDGRAAAMQLAVEFSGRYWLFKIGYDSEFGKCSPGTLLMLHTLGWAAKAGLSSYELLGETEAWIADFWTRDKRPFVQLRSYPMSLQGGAALAADGWVWLRNRLARGRA